MGSLEPGRTIKYMTDSYGQVWANYEGDRAINSWLVGSPSPTYYLKNSSIKEYTDMLDYAKFNSRLEQMLILCLQVYRLLKTIRPNRWEI